MKIAVIIYQNRESPNVRIIKWQFPIWLALSMTININHKHLYAACFVLGKQPSMKFVSCPIHYIAHINNI